MAVETEDTAPRKRGRRGPKRAGVVVVFERGAPAMRATALEDGAIVLGRETRFAIDDTTVSREHARVAIDRGRVLVRDLDSRNGTFVDGVAAKPEIAAGGGALVRLGDAIAMVVDDVS